MDKPALVLNQSLVRRRKWLRVLRHWELYLFLLPAVLYMIIYEYYPMYGVQIAFRDFRITSGITGGKWVGLKHFNRFLSTPGSFNLIRNTLTLSVYSLVVGFPIPIIFSLVLNELRVGKFKKIVQTVSYAPHFISTVVMVSMITMFLHQGNGIINTLLGKLNLGPYPFMSTPSWFASIYVISGIWKGLGWKSVIYISALASVDPELHEAAMIDGASRIKRIIHINIPCILPTLTIMLILAVGNIMSVGFEKAYLMQNPLNLETSEIISTFVYKMGLQNRQYSFSTAIGLFNSVINFILLIAVNFISKRVGETSLW